MRCSPQKVTWGAALSLVSLRRSSVDETDYLWVGFSPAGSPHFIVCLLNTGDGHAGHIGVYITPTPLFSSSSHSSPALFSFKFYLLHCDPNNTTSRVRSHCVYRCSGRTLTFSTFQFLFSLSFPDSQVCQLSRTASVKWHLRLFSHSTNKTPACDESD